MLMLHRFLLCLAVLVVMPAQPGHTQILLAGGHLPVCTSMSPNCIPAVSWSEEALEQHAYHPAPARIERWLASLGEPADSATAREWRAVLEKLAAEYAPMSRRWLSDQLSTAIPAWYGGLDDRARWQLFDHLQEPIGSQREEVHLKDSQSQAAIDIFQRFVAMARETSGRERPRIGISTASSRDPYDALDFYRQVFEQAGAEVYWLPLDRAFSAARAAGRCEDLAQFQAELLGTWERERVYPEAFQQQQKLCDDPAATLQLTEHLDGLFLNGGDQWLTLHAFIDEQGRQTPEWQRIMARLEAGEMVLGGTSAGAAVQSGPVMISNGSSRRALLEGAHKQPPPQPGCDRAGSCPAGLSADSLTFHAGGLDSFALGIVDTHFSERRRQFRLLQLMVDSGIALGLGVDETSAIEVTGLFDEQAVALKSHGESGGWLIMTDNAVVHSRHPLRIEGAVLHYLGPGARLQLDNPRPPNSNTEATANPVQTSPRQECEHQGHYKSFADFSNSTTGAAAQAPHCLLFPLDHTTAARGDMVPLAPPESATGRVSSWSWSLQLEPITP